MALRSAWVAADSATGRREFNAAWAIWYAIDAAFMPSVVKVMDVAMNAANAMDDSAAEREWQLGHTRKLACACLTPFAAPSFGSRIRNSLLAA
jgi:hypothetical protein